MISQTQQQEQKCSASMVHGLPFSPTSSVASVLGTSAGRVLRDGIPHWENGIDCVKATIITLSIGWQQSQD